MSADSRTPFEEVFASPIFGNLRGYTDGKFNRFGEIRPGGAAPTRKPARKPTRKPAHKPARNRTSDPAGGHAAEALGGDPGAHVFRRGRGFVL
jgi:hypothetical protein